MLQVILKRVKSTLRPLDILETGSAQGDNKGVCRGKHCFPRQTPPRHAEYLDMLDTSLVEAYSKQYNGSDKNNILKNTHSIPKNYFKQMNKTNNDE